MSGGQRSRKVGVSAVGVVYWQELASARGMDTGSEPPKERRVLSIQSHVVHGHVGNSAAVFPLQVSQN